MPEQESPPSATDTVESWAAKKNTPPWLYAASFSAARWAIGQLVSEKTYDDTIKSVSQMRVG